MVWMGPLVLSSLIVDVQKSCVYIGPPCPFCPVLLHRHADFYVKSNYVICGSRYKVIIVCAVFA